MCYTAQESVQPAQSVASSVYRGVCRTRKVLQNIRWERPKNPEVVTCDFAFFLKTKQTNNKKEVD